MIKAITVTNYLGEKRRFELANPYPSGFAVSKVDGLGPPKASINMTDAATIDGAFFNSSRAQSRNIVLTLYFLQDDRSIEDIRLEAYKFFPIKQHIKMVVETDNRECVVDGYVESNTPEIFSNMESTQVSIVCPSPYLYTEAVSNTTFYGVDPLFEFPFENEDPVIPLIVMGAISGVTQKSIWYDGDAEVGVVIYMHAIGPVEHITIYNIDTRETMKVDTDKLRTLTGEPFSTGDEIIISTIQGDKYVKLLRAGRYTNILNCMDRTSDWFQLAKGENRFAYLAEDGLENLQFRMENRTLYEGI